MSVAKVIALANQKGGVGKTTTSINLSASLAQYEKRILLVDCDPQANATSGFGIHSSTVSQNIYDVLINDINPRYTFQMTPYGVTVLPATIDLAGAEIELVPMISRENKLRTAIDKIRGDFDYILIDCPPSLGLLTLNSLAAADAVIIPMQCEFYSLEGISQLLKTVEIVRSSINPLLFIEGVVMTMFDARTRHHRQVIEEVRNELGHLIYDTIIPRSVKLSEAASYGKPVIYYEYNARSAKAYMSLAKEVLSRGK